ncbi:MAG: response regulator transcription factor [Thermomicrobiales bacterium]
MPETILVVDDEPSILEVMSLYLSRDGFRVVTAEDGDKALDLARAEEPDLILLDVMLPYRSGLEITQTLRGERSVPIILLTARTDEIDRINGLELGADDYVVKPFSPREVVARVRAVLRRSGSADRTSRNQDSRLVVGDFEIDPSERLVSVSGRRIDLTATEFDLLQFMAKRPRQVFSRAQLLDNVWGSDFVADESTVTVHIRRLREKVEANPSEPAYVQTVWGVGYRFDGGGTE